MKILVVEDEYKLRNLLAQTLIQLEHEVDVASNGEAGFSLAKRNAYDLILLDWMLPKRDGHSVLRELRQTGQSTPIIMITAKTEIEDRINGLDSGADDYLVKPFHVDELIARIKAISRRIENQPENLRKLGKLEIDLITHQVSYGEQAIDVSPRDFLLLDLLTRAPGRIFTRAQILNHVWNITYNPGTNVVDVYVNRLRKKFQEYGKSLSIESIRGVGYRLKAQD